MYRVQVLQTEGRKPWYWRVVAPNYAVILTSETYATRSNALRAAAKFLDDVHQMTFDADVEIE